MREGGVMTFIYSARVIGTSIPLGFPLHIASTAMGGRSYWSLVE